MIGGWSAPGDTTYPTQHNYQLWGNARQNFISWQRHENIVIISFHLSRFHFGNKKFTTLQSFTGPLQCSVIDCHQDHHKMNSVRDQDQQGDNKRAVTLLGPPPHQMHFFSATSPSAHFTTLVLSLCICGGITVLWPTSCSPWHGMAQSKGSSSSGRGVIDFLRPRMSSVAYPQGDCCWQNKPPGELDHPEESRSIDPRKERQWNTDQGKDLETRGTRKETHCPRTFNCDLGRMPDIYSLSSINWDVNANRRADCNAEVGEGGRGRTKAQDNRNMIERELFCCSCRWLWWVRDYGLCSKRETRVHIIRVDGLRGRAERTISRCRFRCMYLFVDYLRVNSFLRLPLIGSLAAEEV